MCEAAFSWGECSTAYLEFLQFDWKWKKVVCKVRDWRSWMTTLISISSKHSLVLGGSPCLTALLQGASCIIHHLRPCSENTKLYRHTKLPSCQQSLCSCADPHLKRPGGRLSTWGMHMKLELPVVLQWNDLHEASEKRDPNNVDYNWVKFVFIASQSGFTQANTNPTRMSFCRRNLFLQVNTLKKIKNTC